MERVDLFSPRTLVKDSLAGVIVFLVALPLCLGIALASGAPLFSGIVAGIVGGVLVGIVSGSHTSVTGPAAGLTAIVAAQIAKLGSFEAFLLAVVIGGVLQIGLGLAKAGALSAFFPSSVIKGLLAAIGVILILKQIPHLLGHDADPEGDMAFHQPDHETTFSEFGELMGDIHLGASVVGLSSLVLLICWDKFKPLKKSLVPAPLIVVLLGVAMSQLFRSWGGPWTITGRRLVQVPVAESMVGFFEFLQLPDFSQITNPAVSLAGVTIAIVASLETLLNLDAVDKLDAKQRLSPPSRELLAQGVGNVAAGLLGGIPVTSVIIRGSVNINAGAQTKLSTIIHGSLLWVCVMFAPTYLNTIPLSCLAAILLMTGFKLASPKLFRHMWNEGRYQFLPFIITLTAIVRTDLLIGILIGLGVSIIFILASNLRRPIRRIVERHIGGEVLHIELANQVSFLNRAALEKVLREAPRGTHVLLDARRTDYIDPDILSLIHEFKDVTAPVYDIQVSLRGFRGKYRLEDTIQFADYATRELQEQFTPEQVLQILMEGNQRFVSGRPLDRDLGRQRNGERYHSHPMAVIFSGIDARSPAELIFDLGLGDVFTIRIGGNVVGPKVLGSMEYACRIGGAKLILVMGHTASSLITHAIQHAAAPQNADDLTGCPNLEPILLRIQELLEPSDARRVLEMPPEEQAAFVDRIARRHVIRSIQEIMQNSEAIRELVEQGR
ncbi:MAG: bifunctional SulP family inorganic anion transporter/carbonic anhydrase, partial [Planctomycetaceae bacterium]|nr:bifunctional SulP family inorganic anion transporter/carbonic anhydrase [Planctomycetaceae bacterium]